ncbi:MAG: hypothetical protein M1834_002381 [Cirrosporium novae-zelandiae]|nr:MAG: hypothetical protein M1834_002381 [Cirrosporium novae-zelandiae]
MQWKYVTFLTCLFTTLAIAAPLNKRALTLQSFNELSISNGTAGNAEAEAKAKFPVGSDLAAVSADDLDTLQTERESAEAAETEAFNPAIDDATDDDEETALENGKIKNKVLKLTAEVLALQIQQAQGEDTSDKIEEEQGKLDTNIALDKAAAGQESQSVDFDG